MPPGTTTTALWWFYVPLTWQQKTTSTVCLVILCTTNTGTMQVAPKDYLVCCAKTTAAILPAWMDSYNNNSSISEPLDIYRSKQSTLRVPHYLVSFSPLCLTLWTLQKILHSISLPQTCYSLNPFDANHLVFVIWTWCFILI